MLPNGILAAALLRHGAHKEFLDRDSQRLLEENLTRPASEYAEKDADVQHICENRGKGESERDWSWPSWTIGGMP